ncbi:multicopper oxidase [Plakobranchus ocellatus]|uniref:Multicopper oxidase n=1 Tax=Plakobranchus ocellatus TaxID=259542 RepID=A0AAV3ZAV8_9GAST|nr:multicopper oxidase [Plakobranchus ocellatus]
MEVEDDDNEKVLRTREEKMRNCKECGRKKQNKKGELREEESQVVWNKARAYDDHPCIRTCDHMAPPRICKYKWTLETYLTMSKACHDCPYNQTHCSLPHCLQADGVKRGVMVVNRKLPGPAIVACRGDTIEVEVHNDLQNSEGTSIHWHGLKMRGTPYMDGVGLVTQCPISAFATFTYRFVVDTEGTFFWHGHSGMQRADGLFGPIIVREPAMTDPHATLYDYDLLEHVMVVNDWLVDLTLVRFLDHAHSDGDNKPALLLINGKGARVPFQHSDGSTHYTPRATFSVQGGKKYRFRVINAGIMYCPIQISIDQHTMTVIASDGHPVEPVVADILNVFAGERYDFILYADKTTTLRNYWIRARGLGDCSVKRAHQVALLKYAGAPDVDPPEPIDYDSVTNSGITLNPWNSPGSNSEILITRMRAEAPDGNDGVMTSVPDKKFYLGMDFNTKVDHFKYNNPEYYPMSSVGRHMRVFSPQINRISCALPPSPPLSQFDDVPLHAYCNENTVQKRCDQEYCSCIYKLDVDLNDLVEVIVIDEGVPYAANHPMHLHGFEFRTVGMGKINSSTTVAEIKAMDQRGELPRTTTRAPIKDTVTVPDGGYTIFRFRADNPGIWFFHCHLEYHADMGMGVLFQVGTREDFPKVPKNFPKCGNFMHEPEGDDHDDDQGSDHGNNGNSGNDGNSGQNTPLVVQCINPPNNGGHRPFMVDRWIFIAIVAAEMMVSIVFFTG